MRNLFTFIVCLFSTCLLAQTKEIAFKSHSGNMKNFKSVLDNGEIFDTDNSNFGLPAPRDESSYKLDSVIYLSDSVSVMVTSEYRRPYNKPKVTPKLYKRGKDTVYNNPLFKRQYSLDSIKNELNKNGNYINPINKVIFVGFDNKKTKSKTKENIIIPSFTDNNNNSPFDKQLVWILALIFTLSLAGGWLSWKLYQPKLRQTF